MTRSLLLVLSAALAAAAQDYKLEPGGAAPAETGAFKSALEAQSSKIVDTSGKPYAEVWLRAAQPPAAKTTEDNVTLGELVHGSFVGVIYFPAAGASDRRGQSIKPGYYSMRYSLFPISGDHQGVAPQRDFFILVRVADDGDINSTPKFAELMDLARKASGTGHPLVLSAWKPDTFAAGLTKEGDHDWVLQKKMGNLPVALIVSGRGEL